MAVMIANSGIPSHREAIAGKTETVKKPETKRDCKASIQPRLREGEKRFCAATEKDAGGDDRPTSVRSRTQVEQREREGERVCERERRHDFHQIPICWQPRDKTRHEEQNDPVSAENV